MFCKRETNLVQAYYIIGRRSSQDKKGKSRGIFAPAFANLCRDGGDVLRCGRMRETRLCIGDEPEADAYRIVDLLHKYPVDVSHFLAQTALVYRAYLLKQYHGIFCKPHGIGINVYMGGKLGFAYLTRYRRRDDGRAVSVPDVVLNYQNGPESALLASDNGT